jgi:hypothetical protein
LASSVPTLEKILVEHLSLEQVKIILVSPLDHKKPMKNYWKMIFWHFFIQNSLNKLGNKSVGNPWVKPMIFPIDASTRRALKLLIALLNALQMV